MGDNRGAGGGGEKLSADRTGASPAKGSHTPNGPRRIGEGLSEGREEGSRVSRVLAAPREDLVEDGMGGRDSASAQWSGGRP